MQQSVFAVERITGTKVENNKRFYQVEWTRSWEPEDNLLGCPLLIKQFWKNLNKENGNGDSDEISTDIEELLLSPEILQTSAPSPFDSNSSLMTSLQKCKNKSYDNILEEWTEKSFINIVDKSCTVKLDDCLQSSVKLKDCLAKKENNVKKDGNESKKIGSVVEDEKEEENVDDSRHNSEESVINVSKRKRSYMRITSDEEESGEKSIRRVSKRKKKQKALKKIQQVSQDLAEEQEDDHDKSWSAESSAFDEEVSDENNDSPLVPSDFYAELNDVVDDNNEEDSSEVASILGWSDSKINAILRNYIRRCEPGAVRDANLICQCVKNSFKVDELLNRTNYTNYSQMMEFLKEIIVVANKEVDRVYPQISKKTKLLLSVELQFQIHGSVLCDINIDKQILKYTIVQATLKENKRKKKERRKSRNLISIDVKANTPESVEILSPSEPVVEHQLNNSTSQQTLATPTTTTTTNNLLLPESSVCENNSQQLNSSDTTQVTNSLVRENIFQQLNSSNTALVTKTSVPENISQELSTDAPQLPESPLDEDCSLLRPVSFGENCSVPQPVSTKTSEPCNATSVHETLITCTDTQLTNTTSTTFPSRIVKPKVKEEPTRPFQLKPCAVIKIEDSPPSAETCQNSVDTAIVKVEEDNSSVNAQQSSSCQNNSLTTVVKDENDRSSEINTQNSSCVEGSTNLLSSNNPPPHLIHDQMPLDHASNSNNFNPLQIISSMQPPLSTQSIPSQRFPSTPLMRNPLRPSQMIPTICQQQFANQIPFVHRIQNTQVINRPTNQFIHPIQQQQQAQRNRVVMQTNFQNIRSALMQKFNDNMIVNNAGVINMPGNASQSLSKTTATTNNFTTNLHTNIPTNTVTNVADSLPNAIINHPISMQINSDTLTKNIHTSSAHDQAEINSIIQDLIASSGNNNANNNVTQSTNNTQIDITASYQQQLNSQTSSFNNIQQQSASTLRLANNLSQQPRWPTMDLTTSVNAGINTSKLVKNGIVDLTNESSSNDLPIIQGVYSNNFPSVRTRLEQIINPSLLNNLAAMIHRLLKQKIEEISRLSDYECSRQGINQERRDRIGKTVVNAVFQEFLHRKVGLQINQPVYAEAHIWLYEVLVGFSPLVRQIYQSNFLQAYSMFFR